jgi:hypothetical protein
MQAHFLTVSRSAPQIYSSTPRGSGSTIQFKPPIKLIYGGPRALAASAYAGYADGSRPTASNSYTNYPGSVYRPQQPFIRLISLISVVYSFSFFLFDSSIALGFGGLTDVVQFLSNLYETSVKLSVLIYIYITLLKPNMGISCYLVVAPHELRTDSSTCSARSSFHSVLAPILLVRG